MVKNILVSLISFVSLVGCSSQDIPQGHKGRMFDKTGALAFYAGGRGFEGPVLNPGTYYVGIYPEILMVDCSQRTINEEMTALTRDGVQFGLDIYLRYSANCDENDAVMFLLSHLTPSGEQSQVPKSKDEKEKNTNVEQNVDVRRTITSVQIYNTYIRPSLGEAVRESISPYIANELNGKREEIFSKMKSRFEERISAQNPKLVSILDLNLSNMDFPDDMDKANTERAVQAVMKDKAIAERERVEAEIETTKMRKQLSVNEAANEVARIEAIGEALTKHPEYLQYDAQQRWNDIYFHAAQGGNLIIAAPNPQIMLQQSAKAKK